MEDCLSKGHIISEKDTFDLTAHIASKVTGILCSLWSLDYEWDYGCLGHYGGLTHCTFAVIEVQSSGK